MKELLCNFCNKICKIYCKYCKVACYCCEECQKLHWNSSHKRICLVLNHIREIIEKRTQEFQKNIENKSIKLKIDMDCYKNYLVYVSRAKIEHIHFFCDLLIASTRILEIYSIGKDNKPFFPDYISIDLIKLKQMIQRDIDILAAAIQHILDNKLELKIVSNNDKRIQLAISNIYKHFDVVKLIINNQNVSVSHLDEFFQSQTIFEFDGLNLSGLSSYDGVRIYFKTDQNSQTIEHEFAHNISRYFDKEKDPRKVSPSKNINLKINNQQVEAGDFYEFKVYNIHLSELSPFCLTGVLYRDKF